MKTIPKIIMAGALVLALTINIFAQTNPQFTAIVATDEQAIRLTWSSLSNEVYEIDEADQLNGNSDGTTAWNKLYDDYPSQGTNTFWLDTGNYLINPAILHPKDMPMRFYRIVDKGLDDLVSDEPTVSIISPTNGSVVSDLLTVIVIASTDQGNVYPKLYVDGHPNKSFNGYRRARRLFHRLMTEQTAKFSLTGQR